MSIEFNTEKKHLVIEELSEPDIYNENFQPNNNLEFFNSSGTVIDGINFVPNNYTQWNNEPVYNTFVHNSWQQTFTAPLINSPLPTFSQPYIHNDDMALTIPPFYFEFQPVEEKKKKVILKKPKRKKEPNVNENIIDNLIIVDDI